MIPIVPAIIPKTESEILSILPTLRFSPEIHVDVVDGQFVPFTSWPYEPAGEPLQVKAMTDSFTLEVDLMVKEPLLAAEAWLQAGADMLVFHIETISLADFTAFVKAEPNVSFGISALNDTPLEDLLAYAAVADYVQLMGIAKIGAQGQGFDARVLARIAAVKEKFPQLAISIDGSVNMETVKRLSEAGVNRLICGSAIIKAPDREQAYRELRSLIARN